MRGILDADQQADAWRMIEAIAAANPRPTMTELERQTLRRLWRLKAVKIVADYEIVKMVHGRIKVKGQGK